MLSTEHPIQINGFTLFRDLNDTRRYYYLPKSEVLLSEGGKKFDFVAYHDFNTAEGKKNATGENENLKIIAGFKRKKHYRQKENR